MIDHQGFCPQPELQPKVSAYFRARDRVVANDTRIYLIFGVVGAGFNPPPTGSKPAVLPVFSGGSNRMTETFQPIEVGGHLLGYHLYERLGILITRDDPAIRQDQCGHASEPEFLRLFHVLIDQGRLAARLGKWSLLMGIFEELQGFLTEDRLCFLVGLGMTFQGKHLDVKSNIFSFFDDLLHLLMKFGAVRSVGVIKDDHLILGRFVTHDEGVIEREL